LWKVEEEGVDGVFICKQVFLFVVGGFWISVFGRRGTESEISVMCGLCERIAIRQRRRRGGNLTHPPGRSGRRPQKGTEKIRNPDEREIHFGGKVRIYNDHWQRGILGCEAMF